MKKKKNEMNNKEEQKERKILYLLTRLKEKGAIVRDADSRKMTNWIIKDDKNG